MKDDNMMPALFIGHGNPMNAIEDTVYSAAWREMADSLPRPEAILCISAHWETEGSFVTAMPHPKTIHDFYGFPEELFKVQYPAPGSAAIAELVCTVTSQVVRQDYQWGLDHGSWAVLRRMYPAADIPVVQLSLDRNLNAAEHYELGGKLKELRNNGVLIVGSGNIVHNLQRLQWHGGEPHQWAAEFDRQAAELIMSRRHDRLIDYKSLGDAAQLSIPTSEHYLPLLYILALQQPDERATFFAEGLSLGSLSMRSVRIG